MYGNLCIIPGLFLTCSAQDGEWVSIRERDYISSSHLGLIRCLAPLGVSVIIHNQIVCNESCNPMQIRLPHELQHSPCMLPKQARVLVTNVLQALTLKYDVEFITRQTTMADLTNPL